MAFETLILQILSMGSILIFGVLGEILSEKSGVVNLAIEGSIALGAASAYAATIHFDNCLIGLFIGILSGVAPALLLILLSIYLPLNMIVVGIMSSSIFSAISIVIGNLVPRLPQKRLVLLSEEFTIYLIFMISLMFSVLLYIVLRRRIGLIIRSVGEDPYTAFSMGINIWKIRTLSTLVSGSLGGLVGSLMILMPMVSVIWREGLTSGWGYILVAITPASLWNPLIGILLGIFMGMISFLSIALQTSGLIPLSTDLANLLPYFLAALLYILVRGLFLRKLIVVPRALAKEFVLEERYE
ncbi:MAG: ABC transporter permease subunit [Sulfolobales archaeon]